jgi:hypothetical protein
MKTELIPDALYWASFNRLELRLSGACVEACSHSGSCDADVEYWTPIVRAQAEKDALSHYWKPTADKIRAELKDSGAWNDDELKDDEQNWRRIVWFAATNIAEEDEPDCSDPVAKAVQS